MGSKDQDVAASSGAGGGFFSSIAAGLHSWGTAVPKFVNEMVGYEGLEVINPDGGTENAEAEAMRGRWKQEVVKDTGFELPQPGDYAGARPRTMDAVRRAVLCFTR